MAESNPELQAKLRELDHELEEGDITTKGCVWPMFQKNKCLLSPSRAVARPRRALMCVQVRETKDSPAVTILGPRICCAIAGPPATVESGWE